MGTANQLRAASSLTLMKVAGVDLPVANDIKVLGVLLDRRLTFDKHVSAVHGAIMQLPCTGDPPHSASTDYGSRTAVCLQSDSIQDRLLQRCAPRRSIRHHPQAAASTEQRRKNRSSSTKTITRASTAEETTLVAGGAAHAYKLALLMFKIRQTSAPAYLSQHIIERSGTRSLRSSDVLLLHVPFRRTAIGKRSFSCAAPTTWNSLSASVINCDTLSVFKSKLKTHLFNFAYS